MGKQPNILLIMTDQQHARMMGCTGNGNLRTPHLDNLAKQGIRFDRAYCTNPVCVPSRTSMATGMMPNALGAPDNDRGMKIASLPKEIDENSMGRIMKRAGYDTFYGGKVHMCDSLVPEKAGFDLYFSDERETLPKACVDFIKRKRETPFFAVASFINPHDICYAHSAHIGREDSFMESVNDLYARAAEMPTEELPPLPDNYAIPSDEPEAVKASASTTAITPSGIMRETYSDRDWRINRWIYCRLTEQVDRHIGEILQGLKESGKEDDTLILFVSDHGNMDGSHALASKSFLYEESVGVPFIMKYPGEIPPGCVDESHLVSTGLDILPTLCDYAGVEIPAHLRGVSLKGWAQGNRNIAPKRLHIISETATGRMVCSKKYKYCLYDTGEETLSDLENDPGEMENLINEKAYEDVSKRMRDLSRRSL